MVVKLNKLVRLCQICQVKLIRIDQLGQDSYVNQVSKLGQLGQLGQVSWVMLGQLGRSSECLCQISGLQVHWKCQIPIMVQGVSQGGTFCVLSRVASQLKTVNLFMIVKLQVIQLCNIDLILGLLTHFAAVKCLWL